MGIAMTRDVGSTVGDADSELAAGVGDHLLDASEVRTVLTAFNDNAAITFLASQAPGLEQQLLRDQAVAVVGGGDAAIEEALEAAGCR